MDGVKVDCQSTLDMIGSTLGGGSAYSAKFHAVLEDSIKQHFPGNALINCMCHSTNDLYRCTTTVTLLFSHVLRNASVYCLRHFSLGCHVRP